MSYIQKKRGFIILSSLYVDNELGAEIGKIPPSMLPLGEGRLYEQQVKLAQKNVIYMTLPSGYKIPSADKMRLDAAKINIIFLPTSLTLTQALQKAALNVEEDAIELIYGDTLVDLPSSTSSKDDVVAIKETSANYPWAYAIKKDNNSTFFTEKQDIYNYRNRNIVCGYFKFSNKLTLVKACDNSSISCVLNEYNSQIRMDLVTAVNWYDCGHLPLYYQSKRDFSIARAFNQVRSDGLIFRKSSTQTNKIRAESNWYNNLPTSIKIYTPKFLETYNEDFKFGYSIEYLYHPLISELYVFGELPLSTWQHILHAIFLFIEKCKMIRPHPNSPEASSEFADHFFKNIILEKTRDRVDVFCNQRNIDKDRFSLTINDIKYPDLEEIVEYLLSKISPTKTDDISFWHGDLFLGNLFYDFRAQRILSVDPRAQLYDGEFTMFGDYRYDLGKLIHSFLGNYDNIILNRVNFSAVNGKKWNFSIQNNETSELISDLFINKLKESTDADLASMISIAACLFFSMLPLHTDSKKRQNYLLCSGILLYKKVRELHK
ncbi:MAG: hypothetical protein CMP91_00370 [Gammaproteobacteria bacterium]|nr:hypothetical protein [Gammaproteobacteria bacterium]|tara:strand:+ start:73575 stop:75212 length:1638 start_codon:yes stop_codon:yes gene_type:complete